MPRRGDEGALRLESARDERCGPPPLLPPCGGERGRGVISAALEYGAILREGPCPTWSVGDVGRLLIGDVATDTGVVVYPLRALERCFLVVVPELGPWCEE